MWTQEERDAAARIICFGGEENGIEFAGRNPRIAWKIQVDLQCELTAALASLKHKDEQIRAARELAEYLIANMSVLDRYTDRLILEKAEAFLERNALPATGAETKEDGNEVER